MFPASAGGSGRWLVDGDHADLRMQSALLRIRILPPPAPGAAVCARLHRARARRATDAGIALVVQRVVRQLARADVGPDLFVRPVEDGTDLDDAAVGLIHF